MKETIENGFYWILHCGDWTIGNYWNETNKWWIFGSDIGVDMDDVIVGDKVIIPKEYDLICPNCGSDLELNKCNNCEFERNESPYCELCGGCGEDGCCSHLNCFRTLIQNPKCDYGKTYLADAMFAEKMYELGFKIFQKLKKHEITSDEAVVEYDENYDIIWNEIYNQKYVQQ